MPFGHGANGLRFVNIFTTETAQRISSWAFVTSDGLQKIRSQSKRWPLAELFHGVGKASRHRQKSRKLAFVPYSTNERQQSRWGGMDFDAHNGESDRARELAFAAFRVLLNAPDLAVILETVGQRRLARLGNLARLSRNTGMDSAVEIRCATIGVPVAAGVCEIFPPDSLPSRYGKGMRAPGCWNPGTDDFSQIVWENCRTSLESVLSGKSKILR
jgi:hypothetical protein